MKTLKLRIHFEEIAILKENLHRDLKIKITSHSYINGIVTFHLQNEISEREAHDLEYHLFVNCGSKVILK